MKMKMKRRIRIIIIIIINIIMHWSIIHRTQNDSTLAV